MDLKICGCQPPGAHLDPQTLWLDGGGASEATEGALEHLWTLQASQWPFRRKKSHFRFLVKKKNLFWFLEKSRSDLFMAF